MSLRPSYIVIKMCLIRPIRFQDVSILLAWLYLDAAFHFKNPIIFQNILQFAYARSL